MFRKLVLVTPPLAPASLAAPLRAIPGHGAWGLEGGFSPAYSRPKFLFCQKYPVPCNKNITAELHYPVNQSRYISVDFISTIKLKNFLKPFIKFKMAL